MAPTKRKGDASPDPQATPGATETPKKRRGRPRRDPLPEDVPEDEDLASLANLEIPPVKDDTDEDYVPGKRASTPKKPKKAAARKKGVPAVETSSRDCTPAEDAAPKKYTPEKHGAATRDSSEDPFEVEPQSRGRIDGEKGTAQESSNPRGLSNTQRPSNTQYGTQSLQDFDMILGSDALMSRLVASYKPIYDAHNKPTNPSGFGGKTPNNTPQMFGDAHGSAVQRAANARNAFGPGLTQSSPLQDFNTLLTGNYSSAQQASSGYAPRSADRGPPMMPRNQPACRNGSFVPSGLAQMADPFVAGNPQRRGLKSPAGQGLFSEPGFRNCPAMGSNHPNMGFPHIAQSHMNMQGLGGPMIGRNPLAFGFPPMVQNPMGYPEQSAGRNLPGNQMPQALEEYILSSNGIPHASYATFENDQYGSFPLDAFAHAGLTSGDRPELEPPFAERQEMNLQKPGVNSQTEKPQAQAPYAESFFAVGEEHAENRVKNNPVSESKVTGTDDVEPCLSVTKPGSKNCAAVDENGNEGEGQKADSKQGRNKVISEVQEAPSSAEKLQSHTTKTQDQAPVSQLVQEQAVASDPETTKTLQQPGDLPYDLDSNTNTHSQDDAMSQNRPPRPAGNAQPEGNKKELTPWEVYLQTPEGQLLLYGSAGKPKPNMHIDLPTFNVANLKLPEPKRKGYNTQRGATLHASGQQMTSQDLYINASQRGAIPGVPRARRPAAYFTDPMLSQDPGAPTAFAA